MAVSRPGPPEGGVRADAKTEFLFAFSCPANYKGVDGYFKEKEQN